MAPFPVLRLGTRTQAGEVLSNPPLPLAGEVLSNPPLPLHYTLPLSQIRQRNTYFFFFFLSSEMESRC